jgi:excisionase family DNA binding protein
MSHQHQTPTSFLSPAELAAILNVSRRTIMRWIRDGELDAIRIGHITRIAPDAYQRFIATHALNPAQEPDNDKN